MTKGFTLLETLLVCLFIPMVMTLAVGILLAMTNFEVPHLNQDDLFKVQLRQMLSRSTILECDETLTFTKNNKEFYLSLDERRIVKKPGFEILLFEVDSLNFYNSKSNCIIEYYREGEEFIEIKLQD